MTITPATLTRSAGVAAIAAGVIFIGVQLNHPQLSFGVESCPFYHSQLG